ncbi:MAG: efflux RND transporter periplasmic adaptor subunit [Desulfobacterales bacterium]|nr:MAG: efflux RND transporter periplasmic adaptor subunit [Desulfobacterales bacterium]
MSAKLNPTPKEHPRRPWLQRIWGLLPAFFLAILIAVIGMLTIRIQSQAELLKAEKAAGRPPSAPEVNVVALELVPGTICERISLPGVTEPWVKLQLLAEVRGKVTQKAVEEGAGVAQGDVIAILDSRDYVNAFKSAQASYQTARAAYQRLKGLSAEQLATRSQLDNALAQMENHKASMDNAALALERCTLRAPMAGVVNRLLVETGQYLNVADPVAEILQIDRLKVKVGIPESDVDAVRQLTDFTVRIDALNAKTFRAQRHHLSQTADRMARLYDLTLSLENPDFEVLPDMFARVEIVKQEIPDGLAVPLYAVITRKNENIVYVVNGRRAHRRRVELGLLEGWRCEVRQGLAPGEQVIVVGQRNVTDGQAVNVVRQVRDLKDILP